MNHFEEDGWFRGGGGGHFVHIVDFRKFHNIHYGIATRIQQHVAVIVRVLSETAERYCF